MLLINMSMNSVNQSCCYHHILNDVIVYIGVCKLEDVIRAPDARMNAKWLKHMKDKKFDIKITGVFDHELYASVMRHEYFLENGYPFCNHGPEGWENRNVKRRIRHVQTGCIFDTQKQAAAAVGCSSSAMSNHLRHPAINKTVRGATFEYYYGSE